MSVVDQLIYAALWLSFGLGHSLLAGSTARSRLGRVFGRYHRLAYNLIALTHIALVMGAGSVLARGAAAYALPAALLLVMDAMLVVGILLGLVSLRSYAAGPFLGWSQIRGDEGEDDQPLVVSGLHRYIRHPLYSAGLLILWGLARNDLSLATAVWGSLYLMIGSRVEERRLVARYPQEYPAYRSHTPAFIPRPRWPSAPR